MRRFCRRIAEDCDNSSASLTNSPSHCLPTIVGQFDSSDQTPKSCFCDAKRPANAAIEGAARLRARLRRLHRAVIGRRGILRNHRPLSRRLLLNMKASGYPKANGPVIWGWGFAAGPYMVFYRG